MYISHYRSFQMEQNVVSQSHSRGRGRGRRLAQHGSPTPVSRGARWDHDDRLAPVGRESPSSDYQPVGSGGASPARDDTKHNTNTAPADHTKSRYTPLD